VINGCADGEPAGEVSRKVAAPDDDWATTDKTTLLRWLGPEEVLGAPRRCSQKYLERRLRRWFLGRVRRRRASRKRGAPAARGADGATRAVPSFRVGRRRPSPRRPTSWPILLGEMQNLWTRAIQEATTLR